MKCVIRKQCFAKTGTLNAELASPYQALLTFSRLLMHPFYVWLVHTSAGHAQFHVTCGPEAAHEDEHVCACG